MEKLQLRVGVPAIIALQSTTGKLKESKIPNCPSDVQFTLVDGRVAYLPMTVADRIRQAGIQAGQNFEIVKASMHDFRLRKIGAGSAVSAAPPAIAQTTTSAAPSATSRNGQNNSSQVPAGGPPAPPHVSVPTATNQLMGCFMQAIDAIQEAQLYANRKGLGITFSSEDVRATAISCWIGCNKGGAR
jgi:hypothetical protein